MQSLATSHSATHNPPPIPEVNYRLGDLLLEKHVISTSQLDMAIRYQQHHKDDVLGDILLSKKLISKRQLTRCLKRQMSLRSAMLSIAFCMLPTQLVVAKNLEDHAKSVWAQQMANPFNSMPVSDNMAQKLDVEKQVVYSISGPISFLSSKKDNPLMGNTIERQQYQPSPSKYRLDLLTDGIGLNIHYEF